MEDSTAAFPPDDKGYSDRNLRNMKRFAEAYPDFPILQVPLAKLENSEFWQVPLAKSHSSRMLNGMSFFESSGDIIEETSLKVFQTIGDGAALASCKDGYLSMYTGLTVLLYNENRMPYYDEQIIDAPAGKCFKQVGVYRYRAKSGIDKTVPIVMLMDY